MYICHSLYFFLCCAFSSLVQGDIKAWNVYSHKYTKLLEAYFSIWGSVPEKLLPLMHVSCEIVVSANTITYNIFQFESGFGYFLSDNSSKSKNKTHKGTHVVVASISKLLHYEMAVMAKPRLIQYHFHTALSSLKHLQKLPENFKIFSSSLLKACMRNKSPTRLRPG